MIVCGLFAYTCVLEQGGVTIQLCLDFVIDVHDQGCKRYVTFYSILCNILCKTYTFSFVNIKSVAKLFFTHLLLRLNQKVNCSKK